MNTEHLTSFMSFMKAVDIYDLLAHHVVFRGQAVSGNLLPGVARKAPALNTTDHEKNLLHQLRLQGASMLPSYQESELDLLVRAQHFGLQTRLLDWTTNPLVALWFACNDYAAGDVYVYALIADDLLVADLYASDPFELDVFETAKTRVFQPRMNNARIVAQHGWFTLHRYSKKSSRFVPLEKNSEIRKHLTEYVIPASRREEMLVSMDRLGVNAKSLFPDFEGMCRHLNWQYKSRMPT